MAAVVAFQVKPISRIPVLGQRRGQVAHIPEVKPEEKAAFQAILDSFIHDVASQRHQLLFALASRMNCQELNTVVLDQVIIKYRRPGGVRIEAKAIVDRPVCPLCGAHTFGDLGRPRCDYNPQVKLIQHNSQTGYCSYSCSCGAVFKRWEGCE